MTGATDVPSVPEAGTGPRAVAVVRYLVSQLVDRPDDVDLDVHRDGDHLRIEVRVAPEDMGRVIGRRGRVARAIRTVADAAAGTDGLEVDVEFVD